jgi:molybdenum cofactor cytidylyltransferase
VLAAGGSTRLGRPKQMLQYRGKTLLQHSVETAINTINNSIIVVTGCNEDLIAGQINKMPVDIIINEKWQDGMASSIVCGLNFLLSKYPLADGVIFMMSDQPFVSALLLNSLLITQQQTGKAMVASSYNNSTGVPALFHKAFFPQLLRLSGDAGARTILQPYSSEVATVSFPQGNIDIDTEEDYEKLLQSEVATDI